MAKKKSDLVYETVWRSKWLTDGAETMADVARMLRESADEVERMAADGVTLRAEVQDDYGFMVTTDPVIAKKYSMVAWDEDGDGWQEPEVPV